MSTNPQPRPTSTAAPSSTSTTTTSSKSQPPLTVAPTALVADKAQLTGTHRITIGSNAIIHPFARLDSSAAEIDIGEGCTVWERAVIGATDQAPAGPDSKDKEVKKDDATVPTSKTVIQAHCTISPHATVAAGSSVGTCTTVEVGAHISAGCSVGAHCRLAPMTSIAPKAQLDDFTVVFFLDGAQKQRVNASARDFEMVRTAERRGKERERELLGRIMGPSTAGAKWR